MALMRDHAVTPDQIAQIKVESFHEAKRLNAIPTNTEQAQYSLPFSVAAALVHGTIGVREVTRSGLDDKAVLALTVLVEVSETDAFNAAFPARRFARVHLVLKDGRTVSSAPTEAQGDPENKVSDQVIWDKFKTLTTPVLGSAWAQSFLANAQALPEQSCVADLFTQMAVKG